MSFVLAAAAVHPGRPLASASGDSAISFSGMEIEAVYHYGMQLKIVVLNNGGIGGGIEDLPDDKPKILPCSLIWGARYDKMMKAFGGKGWYVKDPAQLRVALNKVTAFSVRRWST